MDIRKSERKSYNLKRSQSEAIIPVKAPGGHFAPTRGFKVNSIQVQRTSASTSPRSLNTTPRNRSKTSKTSKTTKNKTLSKSKSTNHVHVDVPGIHGGSEFRHGPGSQPIGRGGITESGARASSSDTVSAPGAVGATGSHGQQTHVTRERDPVSQAKSKAMWSRLGKTISPRMPGSTRS